MKPLVMLFVWACLVASCAQSHNSPHYKVLQLPVRPEGVPDSAFRIGSKCAGKWVFVERVHAHRSDAILQIYNDSGKLIADRRFMVICRLDSAFWKHPTFIDNLREQIVDFDGEKISLKSKEGNYCWMQ